MIQVVKKSQKKYCNELDLKETKNNRGLFRLYLLCLDFFTDNL